MVKKQSNKSRLTELAEIIATAEKEAVAAQMRAHEAEGERRGLEREIKRNQKPTPPMMELLASMAEGTKIRENRFRSCSYFTEDREGHTARIRSSLYYGLSEREAIDNTDADKKTYRINAHGRAVLRKYRQAQASTEV